MRRDVVCEVYRYFLLRGWKVEKTADGFEWKTDFHSHPLNIHYWQIDRFISKYII